MRTLGYFFDVGVTAVWTAIFFTCQKYSCDCHVAWTRPFNTTHALLIGNTNGTYTDTPIFNERSYQSHFLPRTQALREVRGRKRKSLVHITHRLHMRVIYPDSAYRSCPYTKRLLCTLYPSAMAWPEGSSVCLEQTLANEPKPRMFPQKSSKK